MKIAKVTKWLLDQKEKAKTAWVIVVTLMGLLGYTLNGIEKPTCNCEDCTCENCPEDCSKGE